ncbi:MAG: chemotaxis protein [Gammaproteobacteria bacterium]|nr:chemotaxis protein [Gammaproteobacteria bacterium]
MTSFINSVDERTRLAGANRLEVLLFSLGEDSETSRNEVFGINVFKVREVMHVPEITHAPDMPEAVEGMVSLRGTMVPVINLQKFCHVSCKDRPKILMVTEYNKHVQGFLVDSVETIERLSWEEVKTPPPMVTSRLGGLVTAVAELRDQRLVMIMDVEKVLAETSRFYDDEQFFDDVDRFEDREISGFFADDSSVARKQISMTLDHMRIKYTSAVNGAEAWQRLQEIAAHAEAAGRPVTDYLQFILTDVEMPEMDGYVLTQQIKSDARFSNVPVIMHSSLTADANQALGKGIGADAYVSKFEPRELARALVDVLK